MKKNIYLNLAIVIGRTLSVMVILIFLSWTAFIAYWHINPDHQLYNGGVSYSNTAEKLSSSKAGKSSSHIAEHLNVELQPFSGHSAGLWGYTRKTSWVTPGQKGEAQLTFKKIYPFSLYLNYLQVSAMLILLYLSIMEFVNVITSVRAIETFKNSNIHSFRKIGKYQLLLFVLSSVTYVMFKQGSFFKISIGFTPLILMFAALIMAEIFKEGNKLQEENQLTV
ncbi:MAG: DUF2975 domain-containing protein [Pyrinomonadaceae bacterium]|nr:DUF2975 domain-containing protein [Sphingobacteriaceae bacterium]